MTTAAVWIGVEEARVQRCGGQQAGKAEVDATAPRRVHPRNHPIESNKVRDNRPFFEAILAELADVEAWTLVGPEQIAKDFEKYVRAGHAEDLAARLEGVETLDQAADGELVERARRLQKRAG